MNTFQRILISHVIILFFCFGHTSISAEVLFREEFTDLKNWKPLTFDKIERHSIYSIEKNDTSTLLKTSSDDSASGIIYSKEFDVYKYPQVKWRWKITNVFKNGNAFEKKGDDYPIRIYVVFKYDPEKSGFLEKIKYNAAKLVYGKYPPHSTLNYVWANQIYKESSISSPYTDRAKIVFVDMGKKNRGIWRSHQRNILADYKKTFQMDPPQVGSLAIMNDSDNTKESALSYIDFIEVSQ